MYLLSSNLYFLLLNILAAVISSYPESHDNQALGYDRKENLDLSLHNQFDYANLSSNTLIHYMNNNGSSMYGPVPQDMHMNSIVGSNGSGSAQFVITKPRAPRRNSLAGKWNKEEDEQLKVIVQEHGAKNWKKVCNRKDSFSLVRRIILNWQLDCCSIGRDKNGCAVLTSVEQSVEGDDTIQS